MSMTFLTTGELSGRIKYCQRVIREELKDAVFLEGIHYVRPFGGRKILYIWERIEQDLLRASANDPLSMPVHMGGV